MTTRAAQPASPEQVDNIRKTSSVVFDSPERVLLELGYPASRFAASRIIVALEEMRRPGDKPPSIDRLRERLGRIDTYPYSTPEPEETRDATAHEEEQTPPTVSYEPSRKDKAAMNQPTEKECNECHEVKDLDEFAKHPAGKLGRNSKCKPCVRTRANAKRPKAKTSKPAPAKFDPPPEPDLELPAAADVKGSPEATDRPGAGHWCLAELRDPRLSTLEQIQGILMDTVGEVPMDRVIDLTKALAELELA